MSLSRQRATRLLQLRSRQDSRYIGTRRATSAQVQTKTAWPSRFWESGACSTRAMIRWAALVGSAWGACRGPMTTKTMTWLSSEQGARAWRGSAQLRGARGCVRDTQAAWRALGASKACRSRLLLTLALDPPRTL